MQVCGCCNTRKRNRTFIRPCLRCAIKAGIPLLPKTFCVRILQIILETYSNDMFNSCMKTECSKLLEESLQATCAQQCSASVRKASALISKKGRTLMPGAGGVVRNALQNPHHEHHWNDVCVCDNVVGERMAHVCVCVTSQKFGCLPKFHECSFYSRGMGCGSDVSIKRSRICRAVIWIEDTQSTYLQTSVCDHLLFRVC